MVEPYRDRALVVRRYDLGEADRIIVLFTRDHGLVRGVAKGVRRAKSRFGSRLSPFVDVDVNIYPRRGLSTIAGADTVRTWAAPLVDDYARYTCACAVLDVAERIVGEEQVRRRCGRSPSPRFVADFLHPAGNGTGRLAAKPL